ncbi:MAG: hypothetical protein Q8K45_09915 [Rubrivivax sp.]|jgi:hypothetical protein|nr:hypothetical protein [Rubrivivax sp.]
MFCGSTLPTRPTKPADHFPDVAVVGGWAAIDAPPAGEGSLIKLWRELLISESNTDELVAIKSLMGTVAGAATAINAQRALDPN